MREAAPAIEIMMAAERDDDDVVYRIAEQAKAIEIKYRVA